MKGDELAREINKRKPHVPVVLLTGTRLERPLPGIALVLLKPFSTQELRETVAMFNPPGQEHEGQTGD